MNHQTPQAPGVFHPSGNPEVDMRMRASQQHVQERNRATRPPRTSEIYSGLQKEFKKWCDQTWPTDEHRYIVNGTKLSFYIDSVVSKRKKRWCKKHEDPDATLAFKTIELSVAAIVDLWSEQMLSGNNSYPHPRAECQAVLTNLRRFEGQKRRAEFQDRAVSTVNDGYTTTKELADLVGYYLERNTEVDLRNALMCILSHYLYLRGASARAAELADLQSVVYENEGPTLCPGLLFLMTESKTNHLGHLQIGGCIRNKFVDICPLMLLSLYLFARFQSNGEAFPNLSTSKDWFRVKLFKASSPTEEMDPGTHSAAVKRGLLACGINSSKATHLFRGAGARMADVFGVDESQIRRNGHWNSSSMNRAYLTGLPRNLMRQLAGFPKEMGHLGSTGGVAAHGISVGRRMAGSYQLRHGTEDGYCRWLSQVVAVPENDLSPRFGPNEKALS